MPVAGSGLHPFLLLAFSPVWHSYNGGRTAEAFLEFIKEKLAADSGFARVDALASIADKFLTSDNKAALVEVRLAQSLVVIACAADAGVDRWGLWLPLCSSSMATLCTNTG